MSYENLKEAVIKQLGYELSDLESDAENNEELMCDLENITNHGIAGGFGGFVYHVDTVKFFNDNEADIMVLLKEMAESIGESGIYELITGFNCLDLGVDEIVRAIHVPDAEDETTVKNALAWFAGEEIARAIVDV